MMLKCLHERMRKAGGQDECRGLYRVILPMAYLRSYWTEVVS